LLFSSKDERPMPEMLAGGDCDGDIIQVIWEEIFIA